MVDTPASFLEVMRLILGLLSIYYIFPEFLQADGGMVPSYTPPVLPSASYTIIYLFGVARILRIALPYNFLPQQILCCLPQEF
jgi:hypothetical protein